jgi:5-methylcytosine-specific restriction protein B
MWLTQLVSELSWREVVCLILLDKKTRQKDLVKVPEIVAHEFFVTKAAQNERLKNLNNTVWSVLQTHSPIGSQTVSCDKRASQAYFDKDKSGAWYLLADSLTLLEGLQQQLTEYRQAKQTSSAQPIRNERFSMVSFHQAYGYEEFVEGIRPVLGAHRSGQVSYEVQDGAFLQLCQRAAHDPEQRYAMLIDEINRANVARVFGELLSLIEPDKRVGTPNAMSVTLAYSGRSFSVPANVDIYATMNTQDHSLAPLDMALRRRFRFIDCPPQPELLATICVDEEAVDLGQLLAGINSRITQTLGQ